MIEVKNIYKSFSNNEVLKGVSFSISKGEIYGLVGKNGAGKTTLMNIMAGLSSADSGQCLVDGKGITPRSQNIRVGYLPDLPSFFDYLTTGEFIDYLLMHKEKDRQKYLLNLVELEDNLKISTLSRGMRQRLGIAAAIVNDPDVLLLDEPTSALDPSGRMDVMRILSDLKNTGKSIILSTHILTDMERICDKVGFLTDGIIKREIKVRDLDRASEYIRVSFEGNSVDSKVFEGYGLQYQDMGDNVYRIAIGKDVIASQKKIFLFLASCDQAISSIHNEVTDLDKLFQEVCKG